MSLIVILKIQHIRKYSSSARNCNTMLIEELVTSYNASNNYLRHPDKKQHMNPTTKSRFVQTDSTAWYARRCIHTINGLSVVLHLSTTCLAATSILLWKFRSIFLVLRNKITFRWGAITNDHAGCIFNVCETINCWHFKFLDSSVNIVQRLSELHASITRHCGPAAQVVKMTTGPKQYNKPDLYWESMQ